MRVPSIKQRILYLFCEDHSNVVAIGVLGEEHDQTWCTIGGDLINLAGNQCVSTW